MSFYKKGCGTGRNLNSPFTFRAKPPKERLLRSSRMRDGLCDSSETVGGRYAINPA